METKFSKFYFDLLRDENKSNLLRSSIHVHNYIPTYWTIVTYNLNINKISFTLTIQIILF